MLQKCCKCERKLLQNANVKQNQKIKIILNKSMIYFDIDWEGITEKVCLQNTKKV